MLMLVLSLDFRRSATKVPVTPNQSGKASSKTSDPISCQTSPPTVVLLRLLLLLVPLSRLQRLPPDVILLQPPLRLVPLSGLALVSVLRFRLRLL
jgi:hypothetical protein